VVIDQLKGGESVRVTTRQLKRTLEQEKRSVFETRRSKKDDLKMVGLIEMERRLRQTKKRTTR